MRVAFSRGVHIMFVGFPLVFVSRTHFFLHESNEDACVAAR